MTEREKRWWSLSEDERWARLKGELIGYKGSDFSEAFRTIGIYAPYIPLMQTPDIVMNERAYTPKYWKMKIEEIMNLFDFVSVYRIMETLEWEWAGCDTIPPSVDDLRKTARRLLNDSVYEYAYMNKANHNIRGTGGFEVEIDVQNGFLGLYFVPTEYEAYDEVDE